MLRPVILAAARNPAAKKVLVDGRVGRGFVRRFVAGEGVEDAVSAARTAVSRGLLATIDHLGEDVTDVCGAESNVRAYVQLLNRLDQEGLARAGRVEVSLKLSALAQSVDPVAALENAARICEAADEAGTTVTLDMEGHSTTETTLRVHDALRRQYPATGTAIQAYLHRTQRDCVSLARRGRRVRLCKGAYAEPPHVSHQRRELVDAAYLRYLELLMASEAYPMIATHDPQMIAAAERLARGRPQGSFEFQMLQGVRPQEQLRLANAGHRVRIYIPYGRDWYGYLMRRLAERPANLRFFARAAVRRG
jgi:proline dehydrogenase